MSVEVVTASASETDVSGQKLDIKEAIQKSTSQVAVTDLQKKGFKQVKVLNKAMITGLIEQAIDRVISSREEEISKEERNRVVRESQSEIATLTKQRSELEHNLLLQVEAANKRIQELEAALAKIESSASQAAASTKEEASKVAQHLEAESRKAAALSESVAQLTETVKAREQEVERTKQQLSEREQEIGKLKAQLEEAERKSSNSSPVLEGLMVALLERFQSQPQPSQDMSTLQSSIEGLADKINQIGSMGGGAGGGGPIVDKEVILEKLFSRDDGEDMESNVAAVKVKEAKARGVNNTLNKLKALQQGGSKDGD